MKFKPFPQSHLTMSANMYLRTHLRGMEKRLIGLVQPHARLGYFKV